MDEVSEFEAQVAEAESQAAPPAAVKTKTITWHGRTWQIRHEPGARYVYEYDSGHAMKAVETVIGAEQMQQMLALDPDLRGGPDSVDAFLGACNKAWGVTSGN